MARAPDPGGVTRTSSCCADGVRNDTTRTRPCCPFARAPRRSTAHHGRAEEPLRQELARVADLRKELYAACENCRAAWAAFEKVRAPWRPARRSRGPSRRSVCLGLGYAGSDPRSGSIWRLSL